MTKSKLPMTIGILVAVALAVLITLNNVGVF